MKALEKRKRIPILLLLKEKKKLKLADFLEIIPKKTGSGSSGTIGEALKELTNLGLVRTVVRDEGKGWVDYELTELGKKVADKIAEIIEVAKRSGHR